MRVPGHGVGAWIASGVLTRPGALVTTLALTCLPIRFPLDFAVGLGLLATGPRREQAAQRGRA